MPNLRVHISVIDPELSSPYSAGTVVDDLVKHFEQGGPNPDICGCGPPGMIDATLAAARKYGMPETSYSTKSSWPRPGNGQRIIWSASRQASEPMNCLPLVRFLCEFRIAGPPSPGERLPRSRETTSAGKQNRPEFICFRLAARRPQRARARSTRSVLTRGWHARGRAAAACPGNTQMGLEEFHVMASRHEGPVRVHGQRL